MRTPIASFFGFLSLAACGGSTTTDGPIVDGGADGTADSLVADTSGTDTVTPPPDVACKDCVGAALKWSQSGGLVFREESSSVTPCRTYEHRQGPPGGGTPDKTCTQEMAACDASGTGGSFDVQRALAEPELVAAFAAAPIQYGEVVPDGGSFVMTLGDKTVSVAFDCSSGSTGCKPIPAGVKRAVALLGGVDTAQLSTGTCKSVFGATP